MGKIAIRLGVLVAMASSCMGQSGTPQSARQALLEMFFSKTSGTFVKHLPEVTLAALEKSGALEGLQRYSAAQFATGGKNLETFESGPLMLSANNPQTGDKVEVRLESDRLRGELDDITVSFHVFEKGQEKPTPYMPQMTFSLKQEAKVWKLNEISITIHVPLADPELLKAIQEKMNAVPRPHLTAAQASGPMTPAPMQVGGSDAQIIAAMTTILAAEKTYAERYANVGYTCSLSSLDGFGGGEPNEHQAMLINSGLASGKRFGFVFTLTGCNGTPATAMRLTATPGANMYGRKTFCADESGTIKSSEHDANACFASGMLER